MAKKQSQKMKRIGYPMLCGVSMLWLFLSTSLYAQERTLRFEHLSLEQGLSQSSVYAIVQDHKGFMWFGTEDGLNRYDGYRFGVYRNHADDPKSLSSSSILGIYEDHSGVLWIGTSDGGLNRYDRATDTFTPYRHDPENPHSLGDNKVSVIHEDRSGVLWVGTDTGLSKFDREQETFTHYRHDPNNPKSLSASSVWAIYEDRSGVLWVGGDEGGLNKFDRATETFTNYPHDPNDPKSLSMCIPGKVNGQNAQSEHPASRQRRAPSQLTQLFTFKQLRSLLSHRFTP